MTLTTERLKWLHDSATELSATKLKMTMRPDELLVLTSELLANREAQPAGYSQVQRDMMKDILVRKLGGNLLGEKLCMDDIHAATMELIKAGFRLYTAPPAPAVPDDYFGELVKKARSAADKAMRKFPQPNYVLNKVAEESGEVIKAVIHYTEGREEWANVEGEIIDNLAMLIRLVVEGDQVIGFTPPVACHSAILPTPHDPDPIDVFVAQVCGDLTAGHQR